MFIRKNQRRLGGAGGHRTFGEMLFHLALVNRISLALNASLHEVIDPLRWVRERRLNRLVTHVTEIQCHGCSLIFIHDEIARATEVGHYIISSEDFRVCRDARGILTGEKRKNYPQWYVHPTNAAI